MRIINIKVLLIYLQALICFEIELYFDNVFQLKFVKSKIKILNSSTGLEITDSIGKAVFISSSQKLEIRKLSSRYPNSRITYILKLLYYIVKN